MYKRFAAMLLMLTMMGTSGVSGSNFSITASEISVTENTSNLLEDSPSDVSEVSVNEEIDESNEQIIPETHETEDTEVNNEEGIVSEDLLETSENNDEESDSALLEEAPTRIQGFVLQGGNVFERSLLSDPEWPNEGAIYLEKNAERIEDNSWEMELVIKGKDYTSENDIAIIIDNANTLQPYLPTIKEAAKNFGDTLLTEGSVTRIMVVNYLESEIVHSQYFTFNELMEYKSYIDQIKQATGSGNARNLQALIHEADEVLYASDPENQKNMVVLGSSAPTLSFPFVAEGTLSGCRLNHKNLPTVYNNSIDTKGKFSPDYNRTVSSLTGNNKFNISYNAFIDVTCEEHGVTAAYPYGSFSYDSEENLILTQGTTGSDNGFGAIWEARESIKRGTTIFTMSFADDPDLINVLREMASSTSNYYRITTSNNVEDAIAAFDTIASRVSVAAKNGTVTDPMGDLVDLVFSGSVPTYTNNLSEYESGVFDIYISQGSLTYITGSETISWKAGNIDESNDAVMKYKIRLEEDAEVNIGDVIMPNGTTTFNYINYNDDPSGKNFVVPEITIGGATIRVQYYRVNESGEPVNSEGVVVPLANAQRLVNMESYPNIYGTYDFSAKSIDGYIYYGYYLNGIQVPETRTVRITTSESEGSPIIWFGYYKGKTKLRISKTGADPIDENQSFLFRVEGNGTDLTVSIKGNGAVIIKNLPAGKYTVTEITDWSFRYTPEATVQEVTTTPADMEEVLFVNERTSGKWLGGESWLRNIFAAFIN